MVGETISHYRITGKLGEGGMGVVYRATDLKLERDVALKVLSAHLASDTDARSRFLREAKAAAALDHSNICMVHEIDEVEDQALLAMQLIEGPTVKEKIAERPLKLDEALDIAIQTGRGLQAAHEKGVVHRDIKSANLMVTGDGQVKIMDFGLARLADHTQITKTAAILGTPAYMSPEQAQGQPADHRSDIFSLGVVLYEMVTGRLPFLGENDQSVLYAIINQEPEPPTALRTGLPTELDRIILKALAKEPSERYQHIDEMRADLNGLRRRHESASSVSVEPIRSGRTLSKFKVGALVGVGVVASALVTWWVAQSTGEPPVGSGQPAPIRITTDAGISYQPALSPDGQFLAYASDRAGEGNLDIWLKQIGGGSPMRLSTDPADDHQPSFSPDGRTIVFRSERDTGGIHVVSTLGGDVRLLARDGKHPRFSSDGNHIAFDRGGRESGGELYIVSASGGEPRRLARDFYAPLFPVWLPDGRLLFESLAGPSAGGTHEWWIMPIDGGEALPTGVGEKLREASFGMPLLGDSFTPLAWVERDNSALFVAQKEDNPNVWRIHIDPKTARAQGVPERVTTGTASHYYPTVSADGRLAFSSAVYNIDLWSLPLDANAGRVTGSLERLTFSTANDSGPSVSVDGKTIVFRSDRSGIDELIAKNLTDAKERVLGPGRAAVISPDGLQVAHRAPGSGEQPLYITSTRDGIAETVTESMTGVGDWSYDGRYFLFNQLRNRTRAYSLLDLESGEETELLSNPDGPLYQGRFSNDGSWLTFLAAGGPEPGIFVAPFRGAMRIPRNRWIRITGGPTSTDKPRWSPDGNLLYLTSEQDGYSCVYAQPLDPATKHPVGELVDIYHSHDPRVSLRNVRPSFRAIDVARDKLILVMAELTGNIWMMEPEEVQP